MYTHHHVICLPSYMKYLLLIWSFQSHSFLCIQTNGANRDCSVRLGRDLHFSTMICLLFVYKQLNYILILGSNVKAVTNSLRMPEKKNASWWRKLKRERGLPQQIQPVTFRPQRTEVEGIYSLRSSAQLPCLLQDAGLWALQVANPGNTEMCGSPCSPTSRK